MLLPVFSGIQYSAQCSFLEGTGKGRVKYKIELSWKKCWTAMLLYCYHTTCVLHTFAPSFWALEHLFVQQKKWKFSHSRVHLSIDFIRRRNYKGSYCIIVMHTVHNLWTFTWIVHFEPLFKLKGTKQIHTYGFAYFPSILIYVLWVQGYPQKMRR